MLRIIHTADWHLGHQLHGVSRHLEHQHFLDWLLLELKRNEVDVLIVAGDIFDSANPSAAAQSQLYDFLVKARTALPTLTIILIGGNHDSASRLDAPSPILNALGVHVIGGLSRDDEGNIEWQRLLVPLTNANGEVKAWCGAMPFLRNADLPSINDEVDPLIAGMKGLYAELVEHLQHKGGDEGRLVLTGHCYMVNGAISDLSERKILGGNQHALPLELFPENVAYVALGHLHLAQRVGGNEHIRYSGSPIPLSFDEADYQHQVIQIDIRGEHPIETVTMKIPRSVELLRIPNGKDFAALSDVISQLESLELSDLPLEQRPLLELRVRLDKPEPSLRQQIEEVIAKLPVRLLKISTAYSGSERSLADLKIEERLEELQPLDVFERCYQNKFESPPSEEIKGLFNQLLESVQGVE